METKYAKLESFCSIIIPTEIWFHHIFRYLEDDASSVLQTCKLFYAIGWNGGLSFTSWKYESFFKIPFTQLRTDQLLVKCCGRSSSELKTKIVQQLVQNKNALDKIDLDILFSISFQNGDIDIFPYAYERFKERRLAKNPISLLAKMS